MWHLVVVHSWKCFVLILRQLMHHFVPGRFVGSFFPASSITLCSLIGMGVRHKRAQCPGRGHEQTFLTLSWCQLNRQTQLPRSAEASRAISVSRTIILPLQENFLHVSPLRTQTFSSGTLPVQEFEVTISTIKESRLKFKLLGEREKERKCFSLITKLNYCAKMWYQTQAFLFLPTWN